MLENLEWVCHVCGKIRPDDKISVYSTTRGSTRLGVPIKHNVRYCNDNPECVKGAKEINWLKGG